LPDPFGGARFARRLLLDDDFDAAVLRLAHAVGGLHHKTRLAAADHRFTALARRSDSAML
jgi:hypothetical protein